MTLDSVIKDFIPLVLCHLNELCLICIWWVHEWIAWKKRSQITTLAQPHSVKSCHLLDLCLRLTRWVANYTVSGTTWSLLRDQQGHWWRKSGHCGVNHTVHVPHWLENFLWDLSFRLKILYLKANSGVKKRRLSIFFFQFYFINKFSVSEVSSYFILGVQQSVFFLSYC